MKTTVEIGQQMEPQKFIHEDEIDLREIWKALWTSRLLIAGAAILSAILAAAVSWQIPNRYTAEIVISTAIDDDGTNSLASSRFGNLASLAGLNPRSAMMDKSSIGLEVLKSRAFIIEFIRSHDYSPPLVAASKWSLKENKWLFNPEIYNPTTKKWTRDVKPPKKPEPSDGELYNRFIKGLEIEPDNKTGIIRVKLQSLSPVAAKEWLSNLINDLNQKMRQRDIDDSSKSLAYLQSQLQTTPITEMRSIFYQLIEQQTKKIMLAKVRDEYVFKVIDPATIPEEKSSPQRVLIVLGAAIIGGFLGMIFALIRHNVKRQTS